MVLNIGIIIGNTKPILIVDVPERAPTRMGMTMTRAITGMPPSVISLRRALIDPVTSITSLKNSTARTEMTVSHLTPSHNILRLPFKGLLFRIRTMIMLTIKEVQMGVPTTLRMTATTIGVSPFAASK